MTDDLRSAEELADLIAQAVDLSADAVARAKSAKAELEDTGETRAAHEAARDIHRRATDLHGEIAIALRERACPEGLHDSAAARHAAAAAAHELARALGDASADDPREDGSGAELGAGATVRALASSVRAHEATAGCRATPLLTAGRL